MPRWTRRELGNHLTLGTVGWGLTGCGSPPQATSERPGGVVLITADDLGWRDVGAYGLDTVAPPPISTGLSRRVSPSPTPST